MKLPRLVTIAIALISLGAISCGGGAGEISDHRDAGSGDGPPEITCSNDSTCGSAGACVASRCVPRATTDAGTWAIEIYPPLRSGSQLTELPFGSATSVITASAEIELTIPFQGGETAAATLPTAASVIVTVPSQIPGRPNLSFQSMLKLDMSASTQAAAKISIPDALRGQTATVSLIPLSPSDPTSPPHTFSIPIPMAGAPLFPIPLPAGTLALRGLVHDALGNPKVQFTARAFRNGVLVSTVVRTAASPTNPAGSFVLILPAMTGDGITLELAPDPGTSDPWVTYAGLSLTQQNTDLGAITLPPALTTTPFQVTVHGADTGGTPVAGATVRAYTTLEGGDARVSTKFIRTGVSDGGGTANMPLMPGSTDNPRPYTLSVVPPAGSIWESQCLDMVLARWPAGGPTLLRDVTLQRRVVVTGNVSSASGVPVAGVIVTAIGGASAAPRCLPGPTTTSTTSDATGSFTLPLDKGDYRFEYDPPAGSPFPRLIEPVVATMAAAHRTVRLPPPVLLEGDVLSAAKTPLPHATVRIFEPGRCPTTTDPCPPFLRAETQTDASGHFRAVVAQPGTN